MVGTMTPSRVDKEEPFKKEKKTTKKRKIAKTHTFNVLPISKIRRIMKEQIDTKFNIREEAVIAIAKSTELFLCKITRLAYENSEKDKRKGIAYRDVAAVVASSENLIFLEDLIPEKIRYLEAKKLLEGLGSKQSDTFDEERT
eukprot:CFRG2959T1